MNPIKIFVSYSHHNSDWVDENGEYGLIPWMKQQLKRENVVFWTDHVLSNHIGEEYKQNIKKNIKEADIALLLVSQDFATSDFILEFELPWIKEEFQQRSMKIVPLLIDVLAKNGRRNIPWIFELQTIPNETKPIIEYTDNAVEWSKVKIKILDVIFDKIEVVRNSAEKRNKNLDKTDIISNINNSLYNDLKEIQNIVQLPITDNKSTQNEILYTISDSFVDFTETVNGIDFDMVAVKGGSFLMGSPEDDPERYIDEKQHKVTLSDFYIGKTEVTQAQWKSVMGANPSYFKGDKLPVEQVSWNDCQQFIEKLNLLTGKKFDIPSEAQWEFAARGGIRSNQYLYAGSNNLNDVAWYGVNSGNKTHPVQTKQPNELGIYDMSGNVWEWCKDWYDIFSDGEQTNPTGPVFGIERVLRGGGWCFDAKDCLLTSRDSDPQEIGSNDIGFRLVVFPE